MSLRPATDCSPHRKKQVPLLEFSYPPYLCCTVQDLTVGCQTHQVIGACKPFFYHSLPTCSVDTSPLAPLDICWVGRRPHYLTSLGGSNQYLSEAPARNRMRPPPKPLPVVTPLRHSWRQPPSKRLIQPQYIGQIGPCADLTMT